jgi:transcriptional regulator with XRE-family HTH domain
MAIMDKHALTLEASAMEMSSEAIRIKRKVLGVLIRKARTQAGLKLEETAQRMGLTTNTFQAYETGQQEASLPELEVMARLFSVPVQYFWSNDTPAPLDPAAAADKMITLRRKIIGVLLRQARMNTDYDEAILAQKVGLSTQQLIDYELGKQSIPFSELEALASVLNLPLSYFLEKGEITAASPRPAAPVVQAAPVAPVPVVSRMSSNTTDPLPAPEWFEDLSPEVKSFLADPSSLLYLKLSMRLHDLSAETLRALAEGILDITY